MGHIIALRAFQALYTERIPQVIKLAEQAKTYKPEEGFVRSSIGFALGWAYRFSGDLEASYKEFDETSAISSQYGNIYMAAAAMSRNGYGEVLGGHLHNALQIFNDAVDLSTSKIGRRLPVAGYPFVYMCGVFYEWNDLDAALQYAIDGIELCKQVGYIMDQVVGYVFLARVKNAQSDWSGAQHALQIAEGLSHKMKGYMYAQRWVEDGWVRYWTFQGEMEALREWVYRCGLGINDDRASSRELNH